MGTTSSLGTNPLEIGKGLAIKNRLETSFQRDDGDQTQLKCSHCGGTKYTKGEPYHRSGKPWPWWRLSGACVLLTLPLSVVMLTLPLKYLNISTNS